MKVNARAAAGIAAAAAIVTIGVSAPAQASVSVSSRANAAASAETVTPDTWMIAGVYSNSVWGKLACYAAGAGMEVAGLVHGWYCAVDEQSNSYFLWVNK